MSLKLQDYRECLTVTVLVASLGYFVDLFDITLFGVVRVSSLHAIGLTDPAQALSSGIFIFNAGMIGMMIGGIGWGILGDKRGRLSVLVGSILLYSLANIANAFVWNVPGYALCRFLGGVGLAGELGAAITLVAETLPKEKRGVGTTIVATLGMFGIVAAALIGQMLTWKMAYVVGGLMGLALLALRWKMAESGMFARAHATGAARGSLRLLLNPRRFGKYLACIAVGIPIYFTTGILFSFAPELTKALHVQGPITAGNAILAGSIGLTLGDLLSGLLSQWLGSRRKAVLVCLAAAFATMLAYTLSDGLSTKNIYVLCFLIGTAVGYWAVLVTMAAEQFGTNIRATVATSIPNFVRGSAVLVTLGFTAIKPYLDTPHAALATWLFCFGLAFLGLFFLSETFGKSLEYVEA